MKQSWIIGTMMLWLIINFLEFAATSAVGYNSTIIAAENALWTIDLTNFSGAVSAISTLATNVGTYLTIFVQVVFLWNATLFSGNFFWFWQFVCFPISVSFIMVLITLARGVHSS